MRERERVRAHLFNSISVSLAHLYVVCVVACCRCWWCTVSVVEGFEVQSFYSVVQLDLLSKARMVVVESNTLVRCVEQPSNQPKKLNQ